MEEWTSREENVQWTFLGLGQHAWRLPTTQNEKSQACAWLFERRGGGIRTPGTSRYNGFQDRRNRPLCHSSIKIQGFQDRRPDSHREALSRSPILFKFPCFGLQM